MRIVPGNRLGLFQAKKTPLGKRGYTGYCCCREIGFCSALGLWWIIVVVDTGLLIVIYSSSYDPLSSGFDVYIQMSKSPCVTETFFVRRYIVAIAVPT
jgi:hypothetical protein